MTETKATKKTSNTSKGEATEAAALPVGLSEVLDTVEVLVCTGAGGVGKTTTSAALAIEAAKRGRRAAVVTIDPAKRLADALGLDGLTNEPAKVPGKWPGEMWALMLDTKTTFDDLITRNANDETHAQEILDNPFYRNISSALSGTQEFMAMEKLHELTSDDRFDLIVVDTPPSRSALDFLEAPGALTRFLDHRLYRVITSPGRGFAKALSTAAQTFLRTVSKVVGGEVINDVVAFFQAFDGIEHGFRERADAVVARLSSPDTAFVLVASPKKETVTEAQWFAERLAEADIGVRALVVNRMHPNPARPASSSADNQSDEAGAMAERLKAGAAEHAGSALGDYYRAAADLAMIGEREESHLAALTKTVAPAPVVRVPMLSTDVHDLAGLKALAAHLVG